MKVPPGVYELTDEEVAKLPVFDASAYVGLAGLPEGDDEETPTLDPEVVTAALAIAEGELPSRPFHDPRAMDIKAEVVVHDGMGPYHLTFELAASEEGDFDIEWLRMHPVGLQCRVTNRVTHEQRTVNLNEHALMILMAETGMAAITQADTPTPVPDGWDRVEGGGNG